jgi:L-rhamnose isomerase/sugar isomerase
MQKIPPQPASCRAHTLDQSHNVTEPIESLMVPACEAKGAYAQALIVDCGILDRFQDGNEALMPSHALKAAFHTDV